MSLVGSMLLDEPGIRCSYERETTSTDAFLAPGCSQPRWE